MSQNKLTPVQPFGQPADTKNFEKWLATKLNPPVIQQVQPVKKKPAAVFGWLALGSGILAIIILIIIQVKAIKSMEDSKAFESGAFIAGMVFFFLFCGLTLTFLIIWIVRLAGNKPVKPRTKPQQIPRNIYSQYYKLVYPGCPLRFNDVRPSNVYPGTKMLSFCVGDEFIEWSVNEGLQKNDGTTFFSFEYTLVATSRRLDEFDTVVIGPRIEAKSADKPEENEFVSPSISFNQKYKVTSNNPDRIPVTRIFDPSVIHYFDNLDEWKIRANRIRLGNGKAVITWRSGFGTTAWNAGIDNFSSLRLNNTHDVQIITQKLISDFNRFFINFDALRPFDLYHIYPKLS